MPKRCVVPNCRTGRKGGKMKRSVFNVPKDNELLEKWKAAIPGEKELRASHVVCEKHFESQYIHREWIKYGTDGQIIAKSPYQVVRLSKLAIPTKFDDDDNDDDKENKNADFGNRPVIEMEVNDSKPIDAANVPAICHVPSIEESLGATIIANNGSPVADVEVPLRSKIEDGGAASSADVEVPWRSKIEDGGAASSDDVEVPLRSKIEDGGAASSADVEVPLRLKIEDGGAASRIDSAPFPVSPTVTFGERIQDVNTVELQKYIAASSLTSWGVASQRTEEGQASVFSYTILKKGNNGNIPIWQRCIVLNADQTLHNFVYGKRVQIRGTQLNPTLNDITSLSSTLDEFQRMSVCNGLGIPKISNPDENAYQDHVQQWRHRDCTLISKKKRCERCMRLRVLEIQRMKRMESSKLKRINLKLSNTLDQRKILALKKKNIRERRKKITAKRRANALMSMLQEKKEEIARIGDA